MLYGTARDLLIGITVVRPTAGRQAGGKVVKNVAGYDLGKLFTGSYGTLGLITECAFRLHPLPAGAAFVRARDGPPRPAGGVRGPGRAGRAERVEIDAASGGTRSPCWSRAPGRGRRAGRRRWRSCSAARSPTTPPPWWGATRGRPATSA
jgi:glycolate oxidase FAD binding subunit